MQGYAYSGFINVNNCNNVIVRDCLITGRRKYKTAGTYEISIGSSNNTLLYNVNQTNFYIDEKGNPWVDGRSTGKKLTSLDRVKVGDTYYQACWGVMGGNYIKNITYEKCQLSRFDAHCGLLNGKIIDSHLTVMELTGVGTFTFKNVIIEPSTSYVKSPVALRGDYGCSWEGTMIFDGVEIRMVDGANYLISDSWSNWHYGYLTATPSVVLNNVSWKMRSSTDYNTWVDVPAGTEIYIYTASVASGYNPADTPINEKILPYPSSHKEKDDENGDGICDYCDQIVKNDKGFTQCYGNRNIRLAPEFVELSGNTQGIVYIVKDRPLFKNTELRDLDKNGKLVKRFVD
jgi:hypothetical protein